MTDHKPLAKDSFDPIPQHLRHHKIVSLIHSAQVNIFVCRRIQQALEENGHINEPGFLVLASNNAFGAAVETLHALLDSNYGDELRIEPALVEIIRRDKKGRVNKIPKAKVDRCYALIEKHYPNLDCYTVDFRFLTDQLDTRLAGDILRDVDRTKRLSSGMKDLKELKERYRGHHFHDIRNWLIAHKNARQSFTGANRLLLKKSVLDALEKIIKELSIQSSFWFDFALANPDLKPTLLDLEKYIACYLGERKKV